MTSKICLYNNNDAHTDHLLASFSSATPFSASSKYILARFIWFFMNFFHLSLTCPLNISSSDIPAEASSSCGRYILPLLPLNKAWSLLLSLKVMIMMMMLIIQCHWTYSSPTSRSMLVSWLAIPRATAAL